MKRQISIKVTPIKFNENPFGNSLQVTDRRTNTAKEKQASPVIFYTKASRRREDKFSGKTITRPMLHCG
jgi:hypothetical protein